MIEAKDRRNRCLSARPLMWMLVLALLFQPVSATPETFAGMEKVHPSLQNVFEHAPDENVRVIVQGLTPSDDLILELVADGSELVSDLSIIDALVMRTPAHTLDEMASAAGVRWISIDGPVESAALEEPARKGPPPGKGKPPKKERPIRDAFENLFLETLDVRPLWEMGIQGEGIGIAIVDSGIDNMKDFEEKPETNAPHTRIVARESFNDLKRNEDMTGHGTHVAGIAAGSGYLSDGAYTGIAPKANLIAVRVSNEDDMSYESNVVEALQWILENQKRYNIRVVNLSLNSTAEASYHESPLNAAVEILWFNGIVVVASSGNKGKGLENTANAAPANDPFIITVGAADEKGSSRIEDDSQAPFSAHGLTYDGHFKPDIMAPGRDIVSVLAKNSEWGELYPGRVTEDGLYFLASGTSMSAPMVSGVIALMLQAQPELNPDQVKFRLMNSVRRTITSEDHFNVEYEVPYLNAFDAVTSTTTDSANIGLEPSKLLYTGDDPMVDGSGFTWGGVNWNSVNWNSVNWNSVNWNSVNWNSVMMDDQTRYGEMMRGIDEGEPELQSAGLAPALYLPVVSSGN